MRRIRYGTVVLGAVMASACSVPGKDVLRYADDVDRRSEAVLTERLIEESLKFREHQETLRAGVEDTAQPVELVPIEPVYDPLESTNVSISVDNGDAQMVLRAIADQAGLNLLLSPSLARFKRQVTMHLSDVSARQVFDQVLRMLDLSGEVRGNVLIVDTFEERIFSLGFLQTDIQASFVSGGDVFGANSLSGGGGGGSSGGGGNALSGSFTVAGAGNVANDPYEQLEAMLLRLVGDPEGARMVPTTLAGQQLSPSEIDQIERESNQYSLNRLTGTLYVRARPSKIEAVARLVEQYKEVLGRQVLIEAQLLDVTLSDGNQYGVDWSYLRNRVAGAYTGGGLGLGGAQTQIPGASNPGRTLTLPPVAVDMVGRALGLAYGTDDFNVAVNLLREFGTVRVLSNPSIRARNASPALISVGRNARFVSESGVTINNLGGGATTTANVVTDSVFDGVVVGVIPFIDENGQINLTIQPSKTDVEESSLQLVDVGGGTRISLPIVDFKGMTTSLSLRDGDTVMLGGLIDETGARGGSSVPGLSSIPLLGKLFDSENRQTRVRELVIVLSVHVL